jgi:hypothetical protein
LPDKQKTITIFLASSSELKEDRDAFDLYFRQQNDSFLDEGLYLKIVRWEKFLDAMGEEGLQEEYNKALRSCDIFVSLFLTKTGKYTEQEFDVAHQTFMDTGKPHIYTYFKNDAAAKGNAPREDTLSLWAFQDKLKALKHYQTDYDNVEHLKRQFRDQLNELLKLKKL